MIRTFFFTLRSEARRAEWIDGAREGGGKAGRLAAAATSRLSSDRGDTLIEVVISVALISLVVVAVLFGLNSTNRATSASRARSQADVLAQQDEERLRAEPIKKLN